MGWTALLFVGYCLAQNDVVPDCKFGKSEHESYNSCGTPCEEECGGPIPICMTVCVEGCFCDEGFVRDNLGVCISNDECTDWLNSSQCQKQLISATKETASGMVGAFIPSCEPNGQFSAVQCHGSTGFCWCADQAGTEINDTRIRGVPVCNTDARQFSECELQLASATEDSAMGMVGHFTPSCDDKGLFAAVQCYGSIGFCWCADQDGTEITGTRIRGEPVCNKRFSECQVQLASATENSAIGMVGHFTPSCEENGQFSAVQCHGSTGYCWCAERDGSEINGSRIRGEPVCNTQCWNKYEHYDFVGSACQEECGKPSLICIQSVVAGCHCDSGYVRDYRGMCISVNQCMEFVSKSECLIESLKQLTSGPNMVGGFTPQCEPNGQFSAVQCHGSSGHCWCAERDGTEITGTRVRGQPDCYRHKTCQDQYDADLMFLAQSQGMVADFIPANCQVNNPDLWVSYVQDPMMYPYCMCLDEATGQVDEYEHSCNTPCDGVKMDYTPARQNEATLSESVKLIVDFVLKLIIQLFTLFF